MKGVSYCDFFFINKHSDMSLSVLCSCCTRFGLPTVWVTLAQPMVLHCPRPASALQLAVQGLPCHQQGVVRVPQRHLPGPEGRMGPASLAQTRASHSFPADARGLLWQPGLSAQNSPVCTCLMALTAHPWLLTEGQVLVPKCSKPGQPGIFCCSDEGGGTP